VENPSNTVTSASILVHAPRLRTFRRIVYKTTPIASILWRVYKSRRSMHDGADEGQSLYCKPNRSATLTAFHSVLRASAALAIPKACVVVQCGPTCEVSRRAQACTMSIGHISSSSVQPLVPLPDIAAPTRGLNGGSPLRLQHRRAPLRSCISRGDLHDHLRRFTSPKHADPTVLNFQLVSASRASPSMHLTPPCVPFMCLPPSLLMCLLLFFTPLQTGHNSLQYNYNFFIVFT
jgi:hypothetical protein